ncbi:MAG TPA: hypothetical protein VIL78_00320 [Hanamia sp.]
MKKFYLFFCVLLVASQISFAQKGNNQIGIGPEVDFPMGTFGDAYKVGFGGTVKGLLGVGQSGQITLTLGYSTFKGKSGTTGGYSYAGQTYNIIPYLLGYRNNFKAFYIEPQLGFASYTTKVTGFKETETRFTYALGAGYNIHSFDLGLRFQSHEGSSFLGARIAYTINLKK